MDGYAVDVKPSILRGFHKNPRIGDTQAIAASLRAHSQYRPIVVNKGTHTGRENEVLAGNHTLAAIRNLSEQYPDDDRWQTIHTWQIDVDDDMANRIVVADNRTADLGAYDYDILSDLLSAMEDDELGPAGFSRDQLEALTTDTPHVEDFPTIEQGDTENTNVCPTCGRDLQTK